MGNPNIEIETYTDKYAKEKALKESVTPEAEAAPVEEKVEANG